MALKRWWHRDRPVEDAWQAGFDFGVTWVYGSAESLEPPPHLVGRLAAQWWAGFQVGHHLSMDETQLEIHRRRRANYGSARRRSS